MDSLIIHPSKKIDFSCNSLNRFRVLLFSLLCHFSLALLTKRVGNTSLVPIYIRIYIGNYSYVTHYYGQHLSIEIFWPDAMVPSIEPVLEYWTSHHDSRSWMKSTKLSRREKTGYQPDMPINTEPLLP